jgi:hypothetical protein
MLSAPRQAGVPYAILIILSELKVAFVFVRVIR